MLKHLKLFVGGGATSPVAMPAAQPRHEEDIRAAPALKRYLTRHPVLDAEYRMVGYELRLRERVPVPVIPGTHSLEQMKEELLLVSVIDMEYQRALGDHLTFLSPRPESLDNPLLDLLPPNKVVVAVAAAAATPGLLERCAALAARDIPLLLDGDVDGASAPLLAHCRYARLDVGGSDMATLGERLARLQTYGTPRLVAANVDSEEAFDACRRLSFSLFQGGFFACPRAGTPKRVDAHRLRVMELLNLVVGQAEPARLADKLKQDAGLTYRLLRFINAPVNGLNQPIQSISQALMWLGRDQLYRWLTLLLFTAGQPDSRGQTLLRNALVRARFMEKLGTDRFSPPMRGGLFIVGILSQLDALLDLPMRDALAPLNLAPDIADALLHGKGLYGPYLRLAMACERLDLDTVDRLADEYRLDADAINLAHIDALIWAEGLKD